MKLTLSSCTPFSTASGGIQLRQKPQAPTPQAPVGNRQTRKVVNAKVRIG